MPKMRKAKKSSMSARLGWVATKLSFVTRWSLSYRKVSIVLGLGLSLVIVGSYWGLGASRLDRLTAELGFVVQDITLVGRYRTQREDILTSLGISEGDAIFTIDLEEKRARLQLLPWVKAARVSRRLPNLIHIELDEYEPFARLERQKVVTLVDRQGHKITDQYLESFAYLPLIRGVGVEFEAAHLLDLLDGFPVVRNRLVAAEWVQGRRWTLHLDHGGKLLLPELEISAALDRLMLLETEQRILAVGEQTIDLRLDDRVLLRPAEAKLDKITPELRA